jgi:hypothetical protein
MNRIPQPDKPGVYYYQAPGERTPAKVLVFRRNGFLYLSLRREGHPLTMGDIDWQAEWFDDPSDAGLYKNEPAPDQIQRCPGDVPLLSQMDFQLRIVTDGAVVAKDGLRQS